jgi:hypothetical protein
LNDIENYWITQLNLNGYRKNVHPYGVCNLCLNRTDIIQKIYGAIQEYARFSKKEWVN